ncbi:MAG: 50S ribosomal protein L22 [Candidatus Ancaeobacter aquaticus]|nr:50S ribosomal protein L22 [Candidatus Ancaeobacter aquaticus]
MEVRAITKYVRVSTRRARNVVDLIRGARVNAAINTLNFTNSKAAKIVGKTLKSAVANAKVKEVEDLDSLIVKEVYVDGGPIIKRFIPRAMGRATPIQKKTSHITIVLSDGVKDEVSAVHTKQKAVQPHTGTGKTNNKKKPGHTKAQEKLQKLDKKIKSKAQHKVVRSKDQKAIGQHEKKGMTNK